MAYEQPINPPKRRAQIDPRGDTRPAPKIKKRKQRRAQSGVYDYLYSSIAK